MSVRVLSSLRALPLCLLVVGLALSCKTDSTADAAATPTPPGADAPNVDESSIYEVDPEDPYLIFNGTFFDLAPGQPLAPAEARLRKGKLETGDGSFEVYYIDGPEKEELGYILPDPNDETRIGDIYLTSERVVTEQGVRVGNTYAELVERLGALEVHGSEIEGATYASVGAGKLRFRLDEQHFNYDLGAETVSPGAKVVEVVIPRG